MNIWTHDFIKYAFKIFLTILILIIYIFSAQGLIFLFQDWLLCPDVLEDLTKLFGDNSRLSGGNAFKLLFERKLRKINKDAPSEIRRQQLNDLLNVVRCCVHDYVPNNIKSAVKKSKCPKGMGIEAIVELQNILKDYYEELGIVLEVAIDSFVCGQCKGIAFSLFDGEEVATNCKDCKKDMECRGPCVILTSKEQMKLAWEMTKQGGIYSLATAFLDHQPGRTVNLTTLNCAVYDWNVQQMASLFLSHSKAEDQWSVCFALQYFDVIMKKYIGAEKYFKPYGFTTDNAGGLLCGLRAKFGSNIAVRTCKFHFVYSAYQKCGNYIGTTGDKIKFLRLIFALVDAENASQFEKYSDNFEKWMNEKKSRKEGLSNWYEFWYNSRALWSNGFADQNLANTNLVECLQAKYSKKNLMKNLPLDQSIIYGISDAMLYQTRLFETIKGKYKGYGPSKEVLETRKLNEQLRRVKMTAFTKEDLNEIMDILGLPKHSEEESDDALSGKEISVSDIESQCDEISEIDSKRDRTKRKLGALLNSPIINEVEKKRKVVETNMLNENSAHIYKEKTPKKKDLNNLRKPGRPKGTKRKIFLSRHMTEDQDTIDERVIESSTTSTVDKILNIQRKKITKRKAEETNKPGSPKRRIVNLVDSETFGYSLRNHYLTSLKKAYRDRNIHSISHIHNYSFKLEKLTQAENPKRVTGRFKNQRDSTYFVDFQNEEVICSCLDYVTILEKYQDRVCKHIASILLKCNIPKFVKFNGSRTYKRNTYKEVLEILSTFKKEQAIVDPMTISENQDDQPDDYLDSSFSVSQVNSPFKQLDGMENVNDLLSDVDVLNWSAEDIDVPAGPNDYITEENPMKIGNKMISNSERGPFSNIGMALQTADINEWFVEIYSDTGSPRCRSIHCKRKLNKNQACLRTDVVCTYNNRKTGEKYLTVDKMRFCLNNWCHENSDPLKMKYKRFERMTELSLQFISNENKEKVKALFVNSDVMLIQS